MGRFSTTLPRAPPESPLLPKLETSAKGFLGVDADANNVFHQRLRLPAKLGGAGYRRTAVVRHAAFLGAVALVAPALADRHDAAGGVVSRGVFGPALRAMLGANDEGADPASAFATLTLAGAGGLPASRLGAETVEAFNALCGDFRARMGVVRGSPVDDVVIDTGVFAVPVAALGLRAPGPGEQLVPVRKLQHALTEQLESAAYRALCVEVARDFGVDDPLRAALSSFDRCSTNLLSAPPTSSYSLPHNLWLSAVTNFFGAPSLDLRGCVGNTIPGLRPPWPVDAFGRVLMCHHQLVSHNQNRARNWHDPIMLHVVRMLQRARVSTQLEPWLQVVSVLPMDGARRVSERFPSGAARRRIVPDLFYVDPESQAQTLADFKTLAWSPNNYPAARCRLGAVRAVDARAGRVDNDYSRHAATMDQVAGHVGPHGPVAARLAQFGACQGLVCGNFGEVSQGLHRLIPICAKRIANFTWRELGSRNETEAAAVLTTSLYRSLSFAVHRARALTLQHLLPLAQGYDRSLQEFSRGALRLAWEDARLAVDLDHAGPVRIGSSRGR